MIWSPSTTRPHRQREDGHDLVAVDDPSRGVDREAPVGVAVVGDPQIGAHLDDRCGELLQVGRAVAVVDVEAVRVGADDGDRRARLPERVRGDPRGGPVGRVDDHRDAVEAVRQDRQQVGDVAVVARLETADPADPGTGGPAPPFSHPLLDRVLDVVRQLVPAAGEELDPVVGHRVVRGREHDRQVGAGVRGEEGDGRGREDAGVEHVDPGRGEPGDDGRGEELARGPSVGPDHGDRPVPAEGPDLTQDVRRSDREVEGELCRDVLVREAANAVRAEESSHVVPFERAGRLGALPRLGEVSTRHTDDRTYYQTRRGRPGDIPWPPSVWSLISACCTAEPCGPS